MSKSNNPGYALLFVLLTTSALSLYCLALFRSSFCILTLPKIQARVVQQKYLTQGLLEYGIAFCNENKEKIFLEKNTIKENLVLTAKHWPPTGKTAFSGQLIIQNIKEGCTIKALLLSSGTLLYEASCCATPLFKVKGKKKDLDGVRIEKWRCSRSL